MSRIHFNILALTLGIALTPVLAHAQNPAVTFFTSNPQFTYFENSATDFGADSYNLGWEFQVSAPTAVTALGFFTDPTLGLTESHAVGLYQVVPGIGATSESGLLLTSATVPAVAASNIAADDFTFTSISETLLTPGINYVISGVTGATDPFVYDVQVNNPSDPSNALPGLSFDSDIQYEGDRIGLGSSLTSYPSGSDSTDGVDPAYFGPNFQSQPVPETSSVISLGLLLMLGLGSLAFARRRSHA
ncbi:MAG: hypothetical protein ACRYFS_22315 [Janthinobacterium lividum]